jgi:hypothetical protein
VIHDVDESLRRFVRRDAIPGTDVEVVFDAPTKDWASRRSGPAVNLYLYDIREDVRRRHFGEVRERDGEGAVVARHLPPRWFKLSYLVTAWTQRPEDEHRLLSVLLQCFLRRDSLPVDLLAGHLGELRAQCPYTCALPPPEDRALSDVWSALGGELKPSLDLVLTAPFDLQRAIEVGPPVSEPLAVDLRAGDAHDPPRAPGGNGAGAADGDAADNEAKAVAKAPATRAKTAGSTRTRRRR